MSLAVRFVDGPLDGQIFFVPHPPNVFYAQRSVGDEGVICVPSSHPGPGALHAGAYRPAADATTDGHLIYRFERPV